MERFHLIGIKGAGMSSLALLLNDYGYYVQGSDVYEEFFTENNLALKNIPVLPFSADNIKEDFIIIVGNAFIDNEEHLRAKSLNCTIYTYNEYLGILSKNLYSIAISGSHGKTTTTNLIRHVLTSRENPNYLIGDGQGGGNRNSNLFVFEACEYLRHFLSYFPKIAVITNIDYDHPDYYKDIFDVQDAFKQFIAQSNKVVYNGDDDLLKEIVPADKLRVSYGLKQTNDYYAVNISNDNRYTYYDLYIKNKFIGKIRIPLFGLHNVYNSLATIATTNQFIEDMEIIKNALVNFKAGKRRFEEFILDGQIVISDYAHHPKEIKSTIEAISVKYPFKKIIIYFQPHTYTRTVSFLNDFADSLSLADKVYLREIFSSAREKHKTISVLDLAKLIKNSEVINDDKYIEIFKTYKNAVIVFMGAGDIDRNCAHYLRELKNI